MDELQELPCTLWWSHNAKVKASVHLYTMCKRIHSKSGKAPSTLRIFDLAAPDVHTWSEVKESWSEAEWFNVKSDEYTFLHWGVTCGWQWMRDKTQAFLTWIATKADWLLSLNSVNACYIISIFKHGPLKSFWFIYVFFDWAHRRLICWGWVGLLGEIRVLPS